MVIQRLAAQRQPASPLHLLVAFAALTAVSGCNERPEQSDEASPIPSGVQRVARKTRTRDQAQMILVPAGSFELRWPVAGVDHVEPTRVDAFWLDEHEVTVEQYRRFEGFSLRRKLLQHEIPAGQPMVRVNWEDASSYCAWAGGRLPTHVEWQYAARGPDNRRFTWGDAWPPPDNVVNLCDETRARKYGIVMRYLPFTDGHAEVAPVRSSIADLSWCSVRDLGGNVGEWVEAPERRTDGGEILRTMLGAAYTDSLEEASLTWAVKYATSAEDPLTGFRCAGDD